MSYRKDEMSSVKSFLAVGMIFMNLSQADLEMNSDLSDMEIAIGSTKVSPVLSESALDFKADAQRLAREYGASDLKGEGYPRLGGPWLAASGCESAPSCWSCP